MELTEIFMKLVGNNLIELTSLVFSVLALIISSGIAIKGWWRHRNIYKVELHEIRTDMLTNPMFQTYEINEKLSSGNYTIMHTEKNSSGYQILLGKIKK